MQKIILIDNYDSFTYNIFQYLTELGARVLVFKNDEVSLEQLKQMEFSHLVISPGPGNPSNPKDFGVCSEAIKFFYKKIPVLGVCLGHQGIAHLFGAKVVNCQEVLHGTRSQLEILHPSKLYKDVPKKFEVMRYHSLIVEDLPVDFVVTAVTSDKGLIMSFEHKKYNLFGIQYHPESIGTPFGMKILENFMNVI